MNKTLLFIWIFVVGIIPPAFYLSFQNVPSTTIIGVEQALQNNSTPTVLLDVRTAEELVHPLMEGTIQIPYTAFLKDKLSNAQWESLRKGKVLVFCEVGLASIEVTRILRGKGIEAFNVEGGQQAWEQRMNHFRPSSNGDQQAAVISGFWFKPLYTLIALILAIVLRKSTSPDLKALKWAMIFFFIGENFCAANYLCVFDHGSYLLEYGHAYGMLLCFGLSTYAFLEGIDRHVIHYSAPKERCALLALCDKCVKHHEVGCRLQKCFILFGFLGAILCWMPLSADFYHVSYRTEIWGTNCLYGHPIIYQLFETRYCPLVSMLIFMASSCILLLNRKNAIDKAKILFCAASGPLGFALLRFVIFRGYRENLIWMDFWEELTELMFVVGTAYLLWIFRASLFPKTSVTKAVKN